jgi:hypothetical protein
MLHPTPLRINDRDAPVEVRRRASLNATPQAFRLETRVELAYNFLALGSLEGRAW